MARLFGRPKAPSGVTLIVGVFLLVAGLIVGIANIPFWQWQVAGLPTVKSDVFPGFTVAPAPPPESGLMVTSLRSNGPAERSGVAVGDLVEALDSEPVASIAQASAYLRHDPNAVVRIRLLHNDDIRDVTLRLNGNTVHGA